MFCHKCGSELPDGSKFCGKCGEKQIYEEQELQGEQKVTETSVPAAAESSAPAVSPAVAAESGKPAAFKEPAVPAVAAVPEEPKASEEPAAPAAPEKPAVPVAPAAPAAPEKPAAPVAPAAPAAPVKPAAPVAPAAPAAPVKPAAPVAPAAPVKPAAPVAPAAPVKPAAPGTPVKPAAPVQPAAPAGTVGNGNPAAPVQPAKPQIVQFKKKIDNKMMIGIAAAALVFIVVAIALGILLFSGSGGDNAYAYLSNGRYELLTNLNKGEPIEIASSRSEYQTDELLAFSPDGKYIYYYTKVDYYSGTGSLCRAEYGKLKKNGKNNDKYIEVIATNVSLGFQFLDDGSVTYLNGDRTLYRYDGKEATQIAKDVAVYVPDGAKRIVYLTGDRVDGYTMYGVTLGSKGDKVKLASNVDSIELINDFDNILYAKRVDDDTLDLYLVGFEKDAEKLAEDLTSSSYSGSALNCSVDQEKYYCLVKEDAELRLYDYVEDPYASADAGLSEPNSDDFTVPRYSYEALSARDLSESDYEELYTSCTRSLYWYGGGTSMENALNRTWSENNEQIHAVTQNFIDRFGDRADENGFIPVTDDVKAALKEIQKYGAVPEEEWRWMWLCYRKYQSGTDLDYDAYNAAWNEWYDAEGRISLREALKDPENDYPVYTLHCFEKGNWTAIQEHVLNFEEYTGGIVFNTPEMVTETVAIDEINSLYDVRSLFNIDYEAENSVLLFDGNKTCRMSTRAAETLAEAMENSWATLYFTNKEVYLSEDDGALSVATISGDSVNDFSIVTDDAEVLGLNGSTMYYVSGSYQSGEAYYGDLYSFTGGNSTRLAKDVIPYAVSIYDDGVIIAATDYRIRSGFELTMINSKGEATMIADDVTQVIRVNKSLLLYISDGDLYSYNGKEKHAVQKDVDYLWSRNYMEPISLDD